jgi:hypothetical protein
MRAKLKKAMIKGFLEGVPALCPGFEVIQNDRDGLIWKRELSADLFFFITIDAHNRDDIFYVIIKWKEIEDYWSLGKNEWHPEDKRGAYGLEVLSDKKKNPSGSLPYFDIDPEYSASFGTGDLSNIIDPLPLDIALTRVAPLVDDALDQIKQYAMPFFHLVAQAHNAPWPDDLMALYPNIHEPPKLF